MNYTSVLRRWCILAVCAIPLAGCNGSPPSQTSTLVYGRGADADFLDPINTSNGETAKVLYNVFDNLITFDDKTLELVPSLAKEWTISDDGLVYTFELRDDVKFHDGAAFDADAVVFTFERLIKPDHPHVYRKRIPYAPDFSMIKDVKAKDPHTVQFTLKEPSAVFFGNLAMFAAGIVSPEAVKKHGKGFEKNPVGSGPFKFDQWVRKQKLQLLANDDYWNGRPKIDRVIFKPSDEPAILRLELERGDLHIADNLPPKELVALDEKPGVHIQEQQGANVAYLSLNTARAPMDNVKLRRAIAHAIDKDQLIRICYDSQAEPAINPLPPTVPGWDANAPVAKYDLEEAKRLMAEFRAETGAADPLPLKLMVMQKQRPYMQQPAETAQFIKNALSKIGIDAQIDTRPNEEHFQGLSAGDHHMGLIGWSADAFDADNFLYTFFHPDNIQDQGGNNTSRYNNPEVKKLLEDARRESKDEKKRNEQYRKVQEIVARDAPVVPLAHTKVRIAQRDELKGYYLHPSARVRLRKAYFQEQGQ
ncbi:MAG: ABC transporter substrate-binding protein [Pirellulales bacterium]|nr:ABC transporter substrate-binding protein [Pirellulales bacterium]